jgi:hypothetical protein
LRHPVFNKGLEDFWYWVLFYVENMNFTLFFDEIFFVGQKNGAGSKASLDKFPVPFF